MSILCQRAERAVCKALIQECSTALNGIDAFDAFEGASAASVANVYEQAVPDGETITLNFYTGETQEKVETPAIVVSCTNASEDQDVVGNAMLDVNIDLIFPAESDPTKNVIAQLENASVFVAQVIRRSDFADLCTVQHDSLTVIGVDPSGYSGGRITEGRQRMHRYGVRLYCACKMWVE